MACGDLGSYDADQNYPLGEQYQPTEVLQPPINPPYQNAINQKRQLSHLKEKDISKNVSEEQMGDEGDEWNVSAVATEEQPMESNRPYTLWATIAGIGFATVALSVLLAFKPKN
jgi:hypothetical protein